MLKGVISIGVFFWITLICLMVYGATLQKRKPLMQPENCPNIMKYKIGNKTLGIPRNAGSVSVGTNVKLPCTEVLDAQHSLIYRPYKFLGRDESKNRQAVVVIGVGYIPEHDVLDTYQSEKVLEKLQKANLNLEHLPVESGFYKFEYSGNQYLFISQDTDLITPSGNPLTFQCARYSTRNKALLCGTNMLWERNFSIAIGNFTTTVFPVSEWKTLYRELFKEIEKLEIKTNDGE